MKRNLIRWTTKAILKGFAALARAPGWAQTPARWFIEGSGRAVAALRNVKPSANPQTLGETWQLAFAAKKQVPIVRIDMTTAFAEIHAPCPLRGTGDVSACHRMMGYDRAFMKKAGAQFIVLRSQAEPGVHICEVAIRAASLPSDDLISALQRCGDKNLNQEGKI